MIIASLAWQSLKNRKATAILTILSIAVSVALLLSVERIRVAAKSSFTNTLSGTDLIVGARSSPMNLLLYSVFHIGNATNNVSWETYQELSKDPAVKWTIPLSLGDSHKGYRVVGTDSRLFTHYRYADNQELTLSAGKPFSRLYGAVIGAEVASKLNYQVGQPITLSHGIQTKSLQHHDDKPFYISGILARTGTPLDRAILVSLKGIEALHIDWHNGTPPVPGFQVSAEQAASMDLQPSSITAWLVGLKSPIAVFSYQRKANEYQNEALSAILPGIALQDLWRLIGNAETALLAVSVMVVFAGLIGMLTTILTSLNERRREMAVLRSVGARPVHIFLLMISESVIYAIAGTVLGFMMVYGLLGAFQPILESALGLRLSLAAPGSFEGALAGLVVISAVILGAIPAWRAYRTSLADGLTIRI
ncbi:ABC transporter permease [Candidatus Sororendozoicomonas aggregata]|uniref:ABC transporter permease n=1 Tax=Candidatus Sororendozoicomonas aggregata TaxID=3073239 RepID=UPI002ED1065C